MHRGVSRSRVKTETLLNREDRIGSFSLNSRADCSNSVLIFFWQGLDLSYSPGAVTSLPFEGLDLSQKLGRECRFAPETFISRVAAETQVHVTDSRFEGSSENTQLLFVQFE
jgi:hypothetical protein